MRPDSRRHPAAVATTALAGLLLAGLSACSSSSGGGSHTPTPTGSTGLPTRSSTTAPVTPTPATGPVSQANVLATLPGPIDGACTQTDSRNMRSGSLGAGDFVDARKVYKNGGTGSAAATVSLHVIPQNPGTLAGVTVTMTRERKPVLVHTYTSTTHETAGGVSYYVLTFPINEPGPWKLELSAGSDKGCFLATFNRSA